MPDPGLPDHQRELIVELSRRHLRRRLLDGIGQPCIQAMATIDPRRGDLDPGQRVDDRDRHPLLRAEGKIDQAALGFCAPIAVGGDFDLAQAVGFGPEVLSHASSSVTRGLCA